MGFLAVFSLGMALGEFDIGGVQNPQVMDDLRELQGCIYVFLKLIPPMANGLQRD
jgi:hypothetical protein